LSASENLIVLASASALSRIRCSAAVVRDVGHAAGDGRPCSTRAVGDSCTRHSPHSSFQRWKHACRADGLHVTLAAIGPSLSEPTASVPHAALGTVASGARHRSKVIVALQYRDELS
jgi:hypothetical protein